MASQAVSFQCTWPRQFFPCLTAKLITHIVWQRLGILVLLQCFSLQSNAFNSTPPVSKVCFKKLCTGSLAYRHLLSCAFLHITLTYTIPPPILLFESYLKTLMQYKLSYRININCWLKGRLFSYSLSEVIIPNILIPQLNNWCSNSWPAKWFYSGISLSWNN